MKKFLQHPVLPWLLVILLVSLLIIKSISPTTRPVVPPVDNRIDSLSHIVDSLNKSYVKLKQDYDSAQLNVKTEIQYIQIKNAKDISNIRNFTLDQRDSMWSTLNP
jgi:predicted PurR-regulated permease PerM